MMFSSLFKKKPETRQEPLNLRELRLQCLLNTHYLAAALRELGARIESLKNGSAKLHASKIKSLELQRRKLQQRLQEEQVWLQIYSKKV